MGSRFFFWLRVDGFLVGENDKARLGSVWLFYIAALRAVDGNAAGKASFAVVSGDLSSPQDIFFPGAWKGRFQNDMGARNVLGMEPKIMGAS